MPLHTKSLSCYPRREAKATPITTATAPAAATPIAQRGIWDVGTAPVTGLTGILVWSASFPLRSGTSSYKIGIGGLFFYGVTATVMLIAELGIVAVTNVVAPVPPSAAAEIV